MKKAKWYVFVLIFLFILGACDGVANDAAAEGELPANNQNEAPAQNQAQPEDTVREETVTHDGLVTFGDTFQFNGSSGNIEISLGSDVFWGELDNTWSQHHGATIFAIPITIRNISSGTGGLNPFDFTQFSPDGLRLDSIGSSLDYDITWESNMRAGASQTGLLYFLYDDDGEYVLEFSAGFGFGDSQEVIFQIEQANTPNISEFDINSFSPSTFVPLVISDAHTLGDTFTFSGSSGDIEIALGTEITWRIVENTWSQHHGDTVFSIPVSITNTGTETGGFNPFDLTQFGSDGLRLPSVGSSFDDDITWEGSMRAGATQQGNFFFLYVGDGQYTIELAAGLGFGDSVEVIFDVIR